MHTVREKCIAELLRTEGVLAKPHTHIGKKRKPSGITRVSVRTTATTDSRKTAVILQR